MTFNEIKKFFSVVLSEFSTVGAILPTFPSASKSLASVVLTHDDDTARNILEVGPGTGAVTEYILMNLSKNDTLYICELNPEYVAFLKNRFETDKNFISYKEQVKILNINILDLDFHNGFFDSIVSTVPFNNMESVTIKNIFEKYKFLISPGGMCSYIEYMYLGSIKEWFLFGDTKMKRRKSLAIVDEYCKRYEIKRDSILLNIPPAFIHFLKLNDGK